MGIVKIIDIRTNPIG